MIWCSIWCLLFSVMWHNLKGPHCCAVQRVWERAKETRREKDHALRRSGHPPCGSRNRLVRSLQNSMNESPTQIGHFQEILGFPILRLYCDIPWSWYISFWPCCLSFSRISVTPRPKLHIAALICAATRPHQALKCSAGHSGSRQTRCGFPSTGDRKYSKCREGLPLSVAVASNWSKNWPILKVRRLKKPILAQQTASTNPKLPGLNLGLSGKNHFWSLAIPNFPHFQKSTKP